MFHRYTYRLHIQWASLLDVIIFSKIHMSLSIEGFLRNAFLAVRLLPLRFDTIASLVEDVNPKNVQPSHCCGGIKDAIDA
jgi:hypothetical protein